MSGQLIVHLGPIIVIAPNTTNTQETDLEMDNVTTQPAVSCIVALSPCLLLILCSLVITDLLGWLVWFRVCFAVN